MKKMLVIPEFRKSFEIRTSDDVTMDEIWEGEKEKALPGEECIIFEHQIIGENQYKSTQKLYKKET